MRYPLLKHCFLLIILISGGIAGKENPFLEMVGHTHAEYHDAYMKAMSSRLHGDSNSRAELVQLLNEAAAVDGSGEWTILRDMMDNTVRFYESRKGGYVWSADYTAEEYCERMLELAGRADREGFRHLKIYALYQAAEGYNVFVQNYERAFAYYLEAAAEMETIRTADFPPRPHIYNQLAGLYYTFREYGDAIVYYQKVVEDPDIEGNYYQSNFPAINGLGLCYRNGYGDYERSNTYFMQILEQTRLDEINRKVWEGIGEGNIGYNYYLAGDIDTALWWLLPAVEKISRTNDFSFVSQRAVNIADIYLKKSDLVGAKKYMDIALDYHKRTGVPEKNSQIYDLLARYYTSTGDRRLATAYLDSTLTAVKHENDAFSGLVLRRVEQQLRAADERLYEQELNAEQAKSNMYKQTAYIIGLALILILILLALTLFYYRRKRNAYRELVRQSQRWAEIVDKEAEILTPEENEMYGDEKTLLPEESDKMIMDILGKAMLERLLYKNTNLTLDSLAKEIGYNRYYISSALNRCAGHNFNAYINEYRVKEAIRIMSEPEGMQLSIDTIASESGFNDRKNFYRVFKKQTGLSPSEFRKNIPN